jgi:hypothetical protein
MSLRMRTELTHYINFRDLENFTNQIYGISYNIPAGEECSNDVSLTYYIDGHMENYADESFEKLLGGENLFCQTSNILNHLCADMHIPVGYYSIEVSW